MASACENRSNAWQVKLVVLVIHIGDDEVIIQAGLADLAEYVVVPVAGFHLVKRSLFNVAEARLYIDQH